MSRERPHLLVAALALILAVSTLVLHLSLPMVLLGLALAAAAVATVIQPEIGLHLLVLNAMVGLTHVVEMPRVGPLSAPVVIEGLVLGALLFQMAFLRRRFAMGTAQHALMALLAGWILLSLLTGVSVGPENFRQYRNLFLVRLVMFILVTALVKNQDAIKRLVVTFMISNAGLIAVARAVSMGYFGQQKIVVSQNFERTGALVQNPNELAFNLTTMMVLSLVAALYVRKPVLKILLLALAGADLFFIMSTLSRSGFISLCVVLMFLFFKLTSNLRAVAVMLVLALCAWVMMPQELFARFSRIDEVRDVDRVQIAQVGLAMALDNPLLGVGLGNYVEVFWSYNVSNMKRPAPSHNMYLDLAAQMGWPALLLYAGAFAITWRWLRRMEVDLRSRGRTRSFEYLFGLALQAFFVNLAVFGLSGDVEFDYSAFILLGTGMTLVRGWRRALREERFRLGASGRN